MCWYRVVRRASSTTCLNVCRVILTIVVSVTCRCISFHPSPTAVSRTPTSMLNGNFSQMTTQTWNHLTSVNIKHLTTVDNTSAVGNNSRPWVVPSVNKMAVNYHKGETDPSRFRVWWNSSSLWDIFVPPYRQCLTGSSWQQQQQHLKSE